MITLLFNVLPFVVLVELAWAGFLFYSWRKTREPKRDIQLTRWFMAVFTTIIAWILVVQEYGQENGIEPLPMMKWNPLIIGICAAGVLISLIAYVMKKRSEKGH